MLPGWIGTAALTPAFDSRAVKETRVHNIEHSAESTRITLDPMLELAIARLVPDASSWTAVGSRSFLAMGTLGNRDLRVRRWPAGTAPERVRFVHRLQMLLCARDERLCAKPFAQTEKSESMLAINGVMFDVQEWLPGKSVLARPAAWQDDGHTIHRPQPLESETYTALAHRIAVAHQRSEKLAADRTAPHAPVDHVLRAIGQNWGASRVMLRPSAPTTPPIQRWLRLSEQVLSAAEDTVRALDQQPSPPVVAHLSLWPAHVLLDRDDQVMLLDFGAAVATSALLDVAQLVTRFAGWTGEHAERVLGDYTTLRSLTPLERRALPAVAALDIVIEAGRLLRLGYTGALPASSRAAVAARAGAQDLLNSLEAVLPAVRRADNPVPFAKRRRLARIQKPTAPGDGRGPSSGPRKPPPRRRKP